jgi:hypothetical protein
MKKDSLSRDIKWRFNCITVLPELLKLVAFSKVVISKCSSGTVMYESGAQYSKYSVTKCGTDN